MSRRFFKDIAGSFLILAHRFWKIGFCSERINLDEFFEMLVASAFRQAEVKTVVLAVAISLTGSSMHHPKSVKYAQGSVDGKDPCAFQKFQWQPDDPAR